ncbi:MAG: peptide-methionine (S)-S-oxide reductase MsrA [Mucilaginibacter sp.]
MKNSILYIALSLLFFSCANGQSKQDLAFAKLPAVKPGQAVATFGSGCFWASTEAMSELKGVDKAISGYAGGNTNHPTYEEVCSETTHHAEVVQVYYDPSVISYEKLVEAFFNAHNPTELNYQGPDEGESYRSIAFYRTPEEKAILQAMIKKIDASKKYDGKIVTQVVPFTVFYPAENYHQGYFKLHTDRGYIQSVSLPKVLNMRKAMYAWLKPEFQKK